MHLFVSLGWFSLSYCLLCARHQARHFTCVDSVSPALEEGSSIFMVQMQKPSQGGLSQEVAEQDLQPRHSLQNPPEGGCTLPTPGGSGVLCWVCEQLTVPLPSQGPQPPCRLPAELWEFRTLFSLERDPRVHHFLVPFSPLSRASRQLQWRERSLRATQPPLTAAQGWSGTPICQYCPVRTAGPCPVEGFGLDK